MSEIDLALRSGKIAEIEQQGFEAGLLRLPLTVNPYVEDSWECEVWTNGYISAERMNTLRYGVHS